MFARRKRKGLEDEPLVPHGLIWQATDDPESVDDAASANSHVSSEVIEMPLRNDIRSQGDAAGPGSVVGNTSSGSSQSTPTPGKLGAISPPIPWPSPRTASVIRRVPPPTEPALPTLSANRTASADRELEAPPKRPPQTTPDQPTARAQQQQKLEMVEPERTQGSHGRSIFIPVTRALASLGQLAGNAFDGTVRSLRNSRRKVLTTYKSLDLQTHIRRARHTAEKWVQSRIAGFRSAQDRFQAWWALRKPDIVRSRSAVASFSSHAVNGFTTRSVGLVRRARAQKVRIRIRIPQSIGMQALIHRSRMALASRRQAFRRDSRLWTSLAMAALSALLTLGVISAISHQTPVGSAPAGSRRSSATRPSAPATPAMNPAGLLAPRTALASTRQDAKNANAPVKVSTQAKPSPGATANPPSTAAKRSHHNDDEDYVAPDTYHYYGSSGKSR
jgi:hypothetical protein